MGVFPATWTKIHSFQIEVGLDLVSEIVNTAYSMSWDNNDWPTPAETMLSCIPSNLLTSLLTSSSRGESAKYQIRVLETLKHTFPIRLSGISATNRSDSCERLTVTIGYYCLISMISAFLNSRDARLLIFNLV